MDRLTINIMPIILMLMFTLGKYCTSL
jgi:hypothetical protein